MCQITIYRDERGKNIVAKEIFSYEIDFRASKLTARTIIGERRDFRLSNVGRISWHGQDDSLVIQGGIEEVAER